MKKQPIQLLAALNKFSGNYQQTAVHEIEQAIDLLNFGFSNQKFSKIRLIISSLLFSNDVFGLLIELLPFFEQHLINKISTLFQSTIRETPKRSISIYLIIHKGYLKQLFNYADDEHLCSTVSILLRESLIIEEFHEFLLDTFICDFHFYNLFSNSFEICSSSFSILKAFLLKNPKISSKLAQKQYQNIINTIFIQIQELLASKKFLVVNLVLDLITSIVIDPTLSQITTLIMKNSEIFKNVMKLLSSRSKRISNASYHLFKHFLVHQNKTESEKSHINDNKLILLKYISKIEIDESDEDLVAEKQFLITMLLKFKVNS